MILFLGLLVIAFAALVVVRRGKSARTGAPQITMTRIPSPRRHGPGRLPNNHGGL